ncbi:MAG: hypothetical protein NZL83_00325 [Candidatus Absconditabacterales bacterium]|nr:hypothetical protein [Candidatus Absconditabacterales bacterium]
MPDQSLSLPLRFFQNIGAFILGLIFAYGLAFVAMTPGLFTADMMNQYGEIVTSTEGSEILIDIYSGNTLDVKTTVSYSGVQAMIVTFAFDHEKISFNTGAITAIGDFRVNASQNLVSIEIETPSQLSTNTTIMSLPFTTDQTIWQTQVRTVFIVEADYGTGETEDLVVFTNTPPNPNPEDDEYYGNMRY